MKPLYAFLEWYRSISPHIQKDIAAYVAMYNPVFSELSGGNAVDYPGNLIAILEDKATNPMTEVGLLLAIRAHVEFYFLKRCSSQEVQESQDSLSSAKNYFDQEAKPDMADKAVQYQAERQFRNKLWKESAYKWEKLCEGSLSDKRLQQYEQSLES